LKNAVTTASASLDTLPPCQSGLLPGSELGLAFGQKGLYPLVVVPAVEQAPEQLFGVADRFVERQRPADLNRVQDGGHRQRSFVGDLPAQSETVGDELRRRHDLIDNPESLRLVGLESLPGKEQAQRRAGTDEPGQALGPARAGQNPELHLWQPHDGVLRSNTKRAGQGQLQAAPQGVAVHGRDGGERQGGQPVDGIVEPAIPGQVGGGVPILQLPELGANRERPSLAGDHRRADVRSSGKGGNGRRERGDGPAVKGVEPLRGTEPQQGHASVLFEHHGAAVLFDPHALCHRSVLPVIYSTRPYIYQMGGLPSRGERAMVMTRSYCRFCGALCGILVETDGERVTSVRGDPTHPLSKGYTCPKGRALPAFHHHPDRLDQPLLRGQPTSWDEVLGDLAARLGDIVAAHGPDAVASFVGTGSAFDVNGRRLAERFMQALPSRSRYSTATVDNASKPLVAELMGGHPGLVPAVDHHGATLVLLFGTNPVVSHGHLNAFPDPIVRLRALAARGELWVVDPRHHETARLATRHLAVRPGTDYALLAFLIRSLLGPNGGADWAYLDAHALAEDVDRLRAAVAPFDRAAAAARCGLAETDLDDLLSAIQRHRRVAGQTGTGVTMSPAANASEWLMWALHIVTGSFDAPGGMWFNPRFMKCFDRRPIRASDGTPGPGPRSRPELPGRWGELPCAALADEIEAGNVRALFVVGGNPLTALAQPDRLAAAFARLDVLVVADVVRTEVTELATHTFACAGQLERADLPGLADTFQVAVAAQYTPA